MADRVRIWVNPAKTKRVATWVVRCDACPSYGLVTRLKQPAEDAANGHARAAHRGGAVVAVRKPAPKSR